VNVHDLFQGGKFIKASDLGGRDVSFTIAGVDVQELGTGAQKERKPVLHFSDSQQRLPLNKTNTAILSQMFGDDTDRWIGRRVTLFSDQAMFQGRPVMAVRIRFQQTSNHQAPQAPPPRPTSGTTSSARVAQAMSGAMPDAATERRRAWETFKERNPGLTADAMVTRYKQLANDFFCGRAADAISAREWGIFIEQNFKRPVPDDPFAEPAGKPLDDIPF
jgi:hypothetical protein